MSGTVRVRASADFHWEIVHLRIGKFTSGRQFQTASIEFEDIDEFTYTEPIVHLKTGEAQQLMDDLWRCGLRPTEGRGSAGQLDAVKYHLEDLRTLVKEIVIGGDR